MNVVPLRSFSAEARPAADRAIARVAVFDDMAEAEPYWRELERSGLATPYQQFDFLKLWQTHAGTAAGMTPFIVVGFNAAGAPLFVWPLGCRRRGSLRVVEFLGGKHANSNMGLWRRDVAATVSAADLRAVLGHLASRADLLAFVNQPLTWVGATNPFALLPHQTSPDFGISGSLMPDFEALLRVRTSANTRKKLRKKERTLAEFGTVRFERATRPEHIRRVLDAFFKQKSARMRVLGLPDVFAAPDIRRFVEACASAYLPNGEPVIELFALWVDDIIVATLGGIAGHNRFCAMFNSMTQGRHAAASPGELMLVSVTRHCCERGFETLDLGVGDSHYKGMFGSDAEPLFDSYLPLSPAGRLLGFAYRMAGVAKRTIKQRPLLWSMVGLLRRLRARFSV
ncbi:MAG: GNAT family N-acetyltransferase [Pseudolabrys sp.]